MTRKDPLALIEAAYSFEGDEAAWASAVVAAARPYNSGRGRCGFVADLGASVGARTVVDEGEEFDLAGLGRMFALLPPAFTRAVLAPHGATFSFDRVDEVARAVGTSRSEIERITGTPVPRFWGISGGDAAESALIFFSCDAASDLAPAARSTLDAVAAHLGAALRLRTLVGRRPTGDDAATEAVLSSSGRVLDARGAEAEGALPSLIEGVKRSERARSRKAEPEERLALWTALVEARWSIVESVESDGKRLLLACRNEPRSAALRQLDSRERSVLQYAALGHTYKYIGYELGLSVSMVSLTLKRGLRKLGLASRTELIRSFGGLAAASGPETDQGPVSGA